MNKQNQRIYLIILFIISGLNFYSLYGQDLPGYQKLRGDVISSEPEDAYTAHAYNAFDTNEGTCFKAKTIPGWVGLDLQEGCQIKKIRIFPRPDRVERMNGCVFQGADNPGFNRATTLYTITETPEANTYTTYDVNLTTKFRYVRCFSPAQNCNLAELEFYCAEEDQQVKYVQLSNLPTVYLETKGNFNFVEKTESAVSKVVVASSNSVQTYDAEVRGRGNSTWEFMEKKPFRIKFDKKQHFLGLPANAKKWTLLACAVDKTFLRNGLAFEISHFLDFEFTPASAWVDVVLDGFYYGTYMVSDQIEVDKNRINIPEMLPTDIELPNISGGYHLEIDAYAYLEPVNFTTLYGVPFTIKSPDSDEIQTVQKNWIEDHINLVEQRLFHGTEEEMAEYIDVESAVKYYLLSELTGNCDSYWCIPCYKKRDDNKLYFGPVWDYDQAFLTNERVPRFSPTLDTQHGVSQHWFRRIMETDMASDILSDLWKKVKRDDLKNQLIDYLSENSAFLQQSQALNYERWNSLNRKVHFEDALFNTYDEYIDFVKEFVEDRFTWFDENYAADRKAFLPVSSPGNPIQTWQYTIETPLPEWNQPTFDDSGWESGQAPFGTEMNLQNTDWTTDQIYIRTQFFIEDRDFEELDKALFRVFHDEDCWIYLNGELALERSGYISNYQFFEFDKTLLQSGWNSIAVKCTQTGGGQLIDVGVYAYLKETPIGLGEAEQLVEKYNWFVRDGILHVNPIEEGSVLHLYNVEGRLIKQQKTTNMKMQIPLPGRGVYFLNIDGVTVKIIH